MYFPISNFDQVSPKYLYPVPDLTGKKDDKEGTLGTIPWQMRTLSIIFGLAMCLAIYCLKRNQEVLEQQLLKTAQPDLPLFQWKLYPNDK